MKKNRLYAAMAAIVLFTIVCSDDLEKLGNEVLNPEDSKGGVYMTINIAAPTGTATKAQPTGGENGDGLEVGTENENNIIDANFYLIEETDGYDAGSDLLNIINSQENQNIVAQAYVNNLQSGTSSLEQHQYLETCQVNFDINEPIGRTFYVLTLVNVGKKEFTNLFQLRDYLQTTVYKVEGNEINTFAMSTHQMRVANAISRVTITDKNQNPETPAEVSVFVERMAARIDLKVAEDMATDKVQVQGTTGDFFKITGYSVVNQLKAGTYLFKRVSSAYNDVLSHLDMTSNASDLYLKDELYNTSSNQYNFVIDPWTRGKKATVFDMSHADRVVPYASHYISNESSASPLTNGSTTFPDLYINHFCETLNVNLWNTTKDLFYDITADFETDKFIPLLYTQENTTSTEEQINGYSTGIVFKGVYTPEKVGKYNPDNGKIEVVDFNSLNQQDFYASERGNLYADLLSIGVSSFGSTANDKLIKAIFNDSGSWDDVTYAHFIAAVNSMTGDELADDFKGYLLSQNVTESDWSSFVKTNLTWNVFVSFQNTNGKTLVVPTKVEESEALNKNYFISYYKGGECYYHFWIRHANNGNNSVMGVMEFAIVRNNVYQIEVSGVNKLGTPLAFTPSHDNPKTPDETDEIYMDINVYVKDWVLRKNTGIIL